MYDLREILRSPSGPGLGEHPGERAARQVQRPIGVDTLGQGLALSSTPANEDDRKQGAAIPGVTGQRVEIAHVNQGIRLEVVKKPGARKGFGLLPKRWVVEHSFAWPSRFRRLARDYERLTQSFEGYHWLAFSILMLAKAAPLLCIATQQALAGYIKLAKGLG